MNSEELSNIFKIILVGLSEGEKTSINRSISESTFDKEYIPTIGVDFRIKIIEQNSEKNKL